MHENNEDLPFPSVEQCQQPNAKKSCGPDSHAQLLKEATESCCNRLDSLSSWINLKSFIDLWPSQQSVALRVVFILLPHTVGLQHISQRRARLPAARSGKHNCSLKARLQIHFAEVACEGGLRLNLMNWETAHKGQGRQSPESGIKTGRVGLRVLACCCSPASIDFGLRGRHAHSH